MRSAEAVSCLAGVAVGPLPSNESEAVYDTPDVPFAASSAAGVGAFDRMDFDQDPSREGAESESPVVFGVSFARPAHVFPEPGLLPLPMSVSCRECGVFCRPSPHSSLLLQDPQALFLPDPQPEAAWLTLLSAPAWWVAKAMHAVLVSGTGSASDDYVVVSRCGVTIPEILPPTSPDPGHRVDVYNSGNDIDTMDAIPAGTMLFVQRTGRPPPDLPSVAQLMANSLLDCPESLLPQPEEAPSTRYLLLGSDFAQQVLELEYGPVVPQVAAAVGMPPSGLQVWFQRGPSGVFGCISVYGRSVQKCIAYRSRSTSEPEEGHMFFLDARCLGRPVCSRMFQTCIFRVEDLLETLDFSLPSTFEARFSGGVPVGVGAAS